MHNELDILVIDDDLEIIEIVVGKIKIDFAARITTAQSATEAIGKLQSGKHFHFIICDFNMPNGNGKLVFDHTLTMANPPPFDQPGV